MTVLGGTDVPAWRAATAAARSGRWVASVRTELPGPEPVPGREDDLAALVHARGVTAVNGMAGIGKTALATAVAHALLAEQAWDDVVFVDLGGRTARLRDADPGQALADLVRAVAGPGQRPGADEASLRARWQELLATRRMLVVLDNAADAAQARPLVPAGPGPVSSRVLVTSRRPLDLPAADQLTLAPLDDDVAATLLAERIPDAPPGTVRRIVGWAGGLPLALQIARAAVRRDADWPLDDVVHKLTRAGGHRDVDAALALSYDALEPADQDAFRLLALHPGAVLRPVSVAALWDRTPSEASAVLDRLAREQLVIGDDEKRVHDLVRAFAAGLLAERTPRSAQDAGLARLVDRARAQLGDAGPVDEVEVAEMIALALSGAGPAGAGFAVEVGWLLEARGRYDDAESLLSGAANHPDLAVRRRARQGLARLAEHAGRFRDQLYWLDEALRDDPAAEDVLLAGNAAYRQGELDLAAERYAAARDLASERGESRVLGRALSNLGNLARFRRDFAAAHSYFDDAERVLREAGEEATLLMALGNRAVAWKDQELPERAVAPLDEAIAIAERHGLQAERAHLGITRASVARQQGDLGRARAELHVSLDRARQLDAAIVATEALLALGDVEREAGRPDLAVEHFAEVRETAVDAGLTILIMEALERLGAIAAERGEATADALLDEVAELARRGGDTARLERLERIERIERLEPQR